MEKKFNGYLQDLYPEIPEEDAEARYELAITRASLEISESSKRLKSILRWMTGSSLNADKCSLIEGLVAAYVLREIKRQYSAYLGQGVALSAFGLEKISNSKWYDWIAEGRETAILEICGTTSLTPVSVTEFIYRSTNGAASQYFHLLQITMLMQRADSYIKRQKSEVKRQVANDRWADDMKTYAMGKAYKEWQQHEKKGRYKSKLATRLITDVDGIRGILESPSYLAEKFTKWENGKELPEC